MPTTVLTQEHTRNLLRQVLVRSRKIRRRVQQVIEEVKRASAPHEIAGLTKLHGYIVFVLEITG